MDNKQTNNSHLIGLALVELFGLKKLSNGLYYTSWGDKTPMGLALCVKRVIGIEEHKP